MCGSPKVPAHCGESAVREISLYTQDKRANVLKQLGPTSLPLLVCLIFQKLAKLFQSNTQFYNFNPSISYVNLAHLTTIILYMQIIFIITEKKFKKMYIPSM